MMCWRRENQFEENYYSIMQVFLVLIYVVIFHVKQFALKFYHKYSADSFHLTWNLHPLHKVTPHFQPLLKFVNVNFILIAHKITQKIMYANFLNNLIIFGTWNFSSFFPLVELNWNFEIHSQTFRRTKKKKL